MQSSHRRSNHEYCQAEIVKIFDCKDTNLTIKDISSHKMVNKKSECSIM